MASSDRLLVALDVEALADAEQLLARLEGVLTGCKIGSQLFTAAGPAAVEAARIIALPPLAWTFSMKTPRRVASRTAPATVVGMSWYLRSRKTLKPRARAASTARGPAAV